MVKNYTIYYNWVKSTVTTLFNITNIIKYRQINPTLIHYWTVTNVRVGLVGTLHKLPSEPPQKWQPLSSLKKFPWMKLDISNCSTNFLLKVLKWRISLWCMYKVWLCFPAASKLSRFCAWNCLKYTNSVVVTWFHERELLTIRYLDMLL